MVKMVQIMSNFQNFISFGNCFRKTGQKTGFSSKPKVAFPKTEVLEKLGDQPCF